MSTSATTLAKKRKTPGVYVTEFPSFPPSIVGVETAVPIFIGYTETAVDPSSGKQLYLQAIPLSSMADYSSYFGYGFDARGVVEPQPSADVDAGIYDFQASSASGGLNTAGDAYLSTTGNYLVGTASTMAGDVTFTPQFNLYSAMELFFANGGGNCFVISVNNYWGKKTVTPTPEATAETPSSDDLLAGLDVAGLTRGGTMLVVPDACSLVTVTPGTPANPDASPPTDATPTTYSYPGYGKVAVQMLTQAAKLQDRVAILDLPGALLPSNWSIAGMKAQADAFYVEVNPASAYFSYGAAYGPALESSLLSTSDVDYSNLSGSTASTTLANNLLTTQALSLYPPVMSSGVLTYSSTFISVSAHIAAAFPVVASTDAPVTPVGTPATVTGTTAGESPGKDPASGAALPGPTLLVSYIPPTDKDGKQPTNYYSPPTVAADILALDQYLLNAVPLLSQMQQILAGKLNVVPPSGAMAGIWTQNDSNRGVWNAPANISINEAISPVVTLTDEQQGDYNVPLNGNAIDILRAMVNRGTVVWGARTLDGNSLDFRYIQVRRTLIYIEQSIKLALQQFVFAANDGGTWATVTATISNFLTQFWQSGGLMGDKASDAFTVNCGVPTTMSGLDILNGYMIVNVTVQLIHPAEFIELTFSQTMQGV